MLMSIARQRQPNLALRRPKAHSITKRALHSFKPKYCSCTVDPPPAYSFIMQDISGYAGSPNKNMGMGSSSSMICKIIKYFRYYYSPILI